MYMRQTGQEVRHYPRLSCDVTRVSIETFELNAAWRMHGLPLSWVEQLTTHAFLHLPRGCLPLFAIKDQQVLAQKKAFTRCFSVDHMAGCASVLDGRGGEAETSPRRLRVFMNLNIFWRGVISRRGHMQTFSLEFKTWGPVCVDQKNAGILQI